ncbi:5'/3'-nucleotidase SurE [Oscillatoria sp. FACHB-1407]|uniref:5'/3'-nucleotidase SurE n=1 Tax=Oscillatoria sp. FACHB-1407 TaxID=2692847 RepID=UPI00168A39D8|nr:5'/3'-nucleotidase SurE [Oscillatoria sp. FACHB-1407]MBD2463006.1 5'/3'-nucleotidase SurE [Oscillatoria sp. FACHB-1407]
MTVVITNDDGIDAPGIRALRRAVELVCGADTAIALAAPQEQYSGCGHQVTTSRPIQVQQQADQEFAIAGTPADCTRLALTHLVPDAQWVLSGINPGGNLGADVYISGTVAAVREAAFHRIPGIAISHYINRRRAIDWEVAIARTAKVLDKLLHHPPEPGTFWNVNLPHPEAGDPEPELIFCPLCTQPLPAQYRMDGNYFLYAGEYGSRARDPEADVDVCFSGNIAVTQIRL